jgi:hypothetical protein
MTEIKYFRAARDQESHSEMSLGHETSLHGRYSIRFEYEIVLTVEKIPEKALYTLAGVSLSQFDWWHPSGIPQPTEYDGEISGGPG